MYFFSFLRAKFKTSLVQFSWWYQLKARDVIYRHYRLAGRPPMLHFVHESPSRNPLHHMATKSLTPRLTSVLASIRKPHFQLRCTYVGNRDRRLRHSIPAASSLFLQPERVRFNFDLDILYLDISQEEEGLYHFFGVLKESELIRLKYVAIDEAYLFNGVVDLHLTIAGLKRALKAMTDLKEMISCL
jgi:hypothetical protein